MQATLLISRKVVLYKILDQEASTASVGTRYLLRPVKDWKCTKISWRQATTWSETSSMSFLLRAVSASTYQFNKNGLITPTMTREFLWSCTCSTQTAKVCPLTLSMEHHSCITWLLMMPSKENFIITILCWLWLATMGSSKCLYALIFSTRGCLLFVRHKFHRTLQQWLQSASKSNLT